MLEASGKYVLPITFHSFNEKILEQLKILNCAIFPIKYPVRPTKHRILHGKVLTPANQKCHNYLTHPQDKVYRDCLIFSDLTQGGTWYPRSCLYQTRHSIASHSLGQASVCICALVSLR